MQRILSIDGSSDPIVACIFEADGEQLTLVERRVLRDEDLSLNEQLEEAPLPEPLAVTLDSTPITDELADPEPPAPPTENESFEQFLARVRPALSASVLVLDSDRYASLNLSLPIQQAKGIERIIELEVQDLVPFDTQEFLLEHRVTGALPDGSFDVHVGMLPKVLLRNVLSKLAVYDVQPLVVTTPQAALGAIYEQFTDRFSEDAALAVASRGRARLLFAIGGELRSDRTMPIESAPLAPTLNLALAAASRRYSVETLPLHLLAPSAECEDLAAQLGRAVHPLLASEFFPGCPEDLLVPAAAATFVRDIAPQQPFSNFRVGAFAVRPPWRELFRGLQRVAPYGFGAVALIVLALLFNYTITEQRIAEAQEELHRALAPSIPAFSNYVGELGGEDELLDSVNEVLSQQLRDLASPFGLSPLEALLEISRDIPRRDEVVIRRIEIRGTRLTIEGSAPDYAAVEEIERALQRRKKIYKRVRKSTSNSAGRSRGFAFDIILND